MASLKQCYEALDLNREIEDEDADFESDAFEQFNEAVVRLHDLINSEFAKNHNQNVKAFENSFGFTILGFGLCQYLK
jgi:hypothetical protein